MGNIGKVLEIFSAKKGQSGLPRPKADTLNLISSYGIEFDKFAGIDEDKAVMVVGKYAYDLALENGITLKEGSLGENILLDFNPHDYKVGTIFQVGDSLLQITQACTICNHLSVFDKSLPLLIKNCRGLYCKVLEGAEVSKGSFVEVLEESHLNKKIAS